MLGVVAWWITVIGALNIGITNAFGQDFIADLFGGKIMKVVYIVVGVAAIWLILEKFNVVKK